MYNHLDKDGRKVILLGSKMLKRLIY